MTAQEDRVLEVVAAGIDSCITELQKHPRFRVTATMLAAARLDFLARLHGVTESELEQIAAMAVLRSASRRPKRPN